MLKVKYIFDGQCLKLWCKFVNNKSPSYSPRLHLSMNYTNGKPAATICSNRIPDVQLAHVRSRVSKLSMIGSDNGLSPGRRQAIIRTNSELMLIGPLGTNFSEILINSVTFSVKKCLSLNVLRHRTSYLCFDPSFQGPLLLTWFNFNPSMDK